MRDYELMLVLQPELEDEEVDAAVQMVRDVLDREGGTLDFAGQLVDKKGNVAEPKDGWKARRMAYPIGGHQEAYYTILRFRVEPPVIDEVERVLNISDDVLRHLVTRLETELETAGAGEEPEE